MQGHSHRNEKFHGNKALQARHSSIAFIVFSIPILYLLTCYARKIGLALAPPLDAREISNNTTDNDSIHLLAKFPHRHSLMKITNCLEEANCSKGTWRDNTAISKSRNFYPRWPKSVNTTFSLNETDSCSVFAFFNCAEKTQGRALGENLKALNSTLRLGDRSCSDNTVADTSNALALTY
jgi:hypothetical protein